MLVDYTDTPTIRGLLGVNELELEDADILGPTADITITDGLLDLGVSVPSMYATVAALSNRTADQARYYEQVRLYSACLVASSLVGTLPISVPRKLTDSKATLERVDDPFMRLEASLKGLMSTLKGRILATLLVLDPSATVTATVSRVYGSAVGLGVDPVTGV
jgi:hypothetical protein